MRGGSLIVVSAIHGVVGYFTRKIREILLGKPYVIKYGFCLPPIFVQGGSNKSRGMRKKQETSEEVQIIEPVLYPEGHH